MSRDFPSPYEAPIELCEEILLKNSKGEEMVMDIVLEGSGGFHRISLTPMGTSPVTGIMIPGSRESALKIFQEAKGMKGRTSEEIEEFLQKSSKNMIN